MGKLATLKEDKERITNFELVETGDEEVEALIMRKEVSVKDLEGIAQALTGGEKYYQYQVQCPCDDECGFGETIM